jgi:hypothetical protein
MNYQKIYDAIINRAKTRAIVDYKESHHIVPRCLGGKDIKDNLVDLTYREHYICHWLLWKIHKTSKLAHAFWKMMSVGPGQKRTYTSHAYNAAKAAHTAEMRTHVGAKNNFYGKKHTQETKDLLSKKALSRESPWEKRSEESKQKYLAAVSKPKSLEHRAKIGRRGLIMLKNKLTLETIRVAREEKPKYDPEIWVSPVSLLPPSGLGSKWFTNGKESVKVYNSESAPIGFYPGRHKRKNI